LASSIISDGGACDGGSASGELAALGGFCPDSPVSGETACSAVQAGLHAARTNKRGARVHLDAFIPEIP
jgi:hypothetical protein